MRYSVFDWDMGVYTYYEAPGESLGVRPKPRVTLSGSNDRGQQPEALMPVLPSGARRIGRGKEARGRIAVLPDQAALVHDRRFGVEGLGNTTLPQAGKTQAGKAHPLTTAAIYVGALLLARRFVPYVIDKVF